MPGKKRGDMTTYAKANTFIEGKNKSSLFANKLMAIGLYKAQHGEYKVSGGGNIICDIPATELREYMKISGNSLYKNLKTTSKKIISYYLGIEDEEQHRFRYVNILTEARYDNGVLSLYFNGDLKQNLYELKKNYTILQLPLMLKWKNTYSFRLYEILLRYAYGNDSGAYEVEFGTAELKFMLGCYNADTPEIRSLLENSEAPDYETAEGYIKPQVSRDGRVVENTYKKWYDFKRLALDPAIREINKTDEADIEITKVKPIKSGRGGRVTKIVFCYFRKDIKKNTPKEDTLKKSLSEADKFKIQYDIMQIFSSYDLSPQDIISICNAANYDEEKIRNVYKIMTQNKGEIKNVVGWIISAIENEYKESKAKPKENNFNSFSQREYDWDEMEKILVSN